MMVTLVYNYCTISMPMRHKQTGWGIFQFHKAFGWPRAIVKDVLSKVPNSETELKIMWLENKFLNHIVMPDLIFVR